MHSRQQDGRRSRSLPLEQTDGLVAQEGIIAIQQQCHVDADLRAINPFQSEEDGFAHLARGFDGQSLDQRRDGLRGAGITQVLGCVTAIGLVFQSQVGNQCLNIHNLLSTARAISQLGRTSQAAPRSIASRGMP